jgi:hypothetical protein
VAAGEVRPAQMQHVHERASETLLSHKLARLIGTIQQETLHCPDIHAPPLVIVLHRSCFAVSGDRYCIARINWATWCRLIEMHTYWK